MSLSRPARFGAVLGGVLAALTLGAASVAGACPPPPHLSYVALGDSYTAAPGVPTQDGTPCARSDHNYPSLVAATLRAAPFLDPACSGAKTVDMLAPQSSNGAVINPPQFDSLSRATRLVTVGIGGNDVGFSNIAGTCIGLSTSDPTGSPCRDHFTSGGTDQLAELLAQTAPKVAAVIDGIRVRSPFARILVVGYPAVLPDSGSGCFPELPIAAGDVAYLRDFVKSLDAMIANQARRHRARFVDTYAPTVGHDVCQPTGTRWIEGVHPTSPAAPLHPNALGEQAMAGAVLAVLHR
jgi:lysophospholipase L1-like esterase